MKKTICFLMIAAFAGGLFISVLPLRAEMLEMSHDELEGVTGQGWISFVLNKGEIGWAIESRKLNDQAERDEEGRKLTPSNNTNQMLMNSFWGSFVKNVVDFDERNKEREDSKGAVQGNGLSEAGLIAPALFNPLIVISGGTIPVPIFSGLLGIGLF